MTGLRRSQRMLRNDAGPDRLGSPLRKAAGAIDVSKKESPLEASAVQSGVPGYAALAGGLSCVSGMLWAIAMSATATPMCAGVASPYRTVAVSTRMRDRRENRARAQAILEKAYICSPFWGHSAKRWYTGAL